MWKRTAAALCLLAAVSVLFFGGAHARAARPEPVYTEITDRAGLEKIAQKPDGAYRLAADIDMGGALWTPVPFSGSFDGAGHTLYNLKIEQPGDRPGKSVDGNHKSYETAFAGFFSIVEKAEIRELNLLNVSVFVTDAENCFAAGLAGCANSTAISGCRVSGRITLYLKGCMCGVAGLVGYGSGTITDSEADVTLVLVDENREERCEEFLGGILACGYTDLDACSVRLSGYASVHGYVHNGGIVGMHHIPNRGKDHRGFVKNCSVDASITFFEDCADRRAYCKAIIGEKLNDLVTLKNNETVRFESSESTVYDRPLLPEACASPACDAVVTPPTAAAFGYTTYTCQTCGYAYTDDYVAPIAGK